MFVSCVVSPCRQRRQKRNRTRPRTLFSTTTAPHTRTYTVRYTRSVLKTERERKKHVYLVSIPGWHRRCFFPIVNFLFCFFFGVCVGRFGFPMASLSSSSFLPVGTASENSHYSSNVFFGEKLSVHSATFVKDSSSTKELREEQEKVVFER